MEIGKKCGGGRGGGRTALIFKIKGRAFFEDCLSFQLAIMIIGDILDHRNVLNSSQDC